MGRRTMAAVTLWRRSLNSRSETLSTSGMVTICTCHRRLHVSTRARLRSSPPTMVPEGCKVGAQSTTSRRRGLTSSHSYVACSATLDSPWSARETRTHTTCSVRTVPSRGRACGHDLPSRVRVPPLQCPASKPFLMALLIRLLSTSSLTSSSPRALRSSEIEGTPATSLG
jgi:hypothetical protein